MPKCTVLVTHCRPGAMLSLQGFTALPKMREMMARDRGRVAKFCQSEPWRPGPPAVYLLWLETIPKNTTGTGNSVSCLSGTTWAGVTSRWSDDQCTWAQQGNITRDPKTEDTGEKRQLQAKSQGGTDMGQRAEYNALFGEGISQRMSSKNPVLYLLHSSCQALDKWLIPASSYTWKLNKLLLWILMILTIYI